MKRKADTRIRPGVSKRRLKRARTGASANLPALPRNFEKQYDVNDYKVTDKVVAATGVALAGLIINVMSNIVQGTGYKDQMVGQKLNPQGWQSKWQWIVGDTTNFCRLIFFQWFDSATPNTGTVLEVATNPYSPVSLVNRENINVLKDVGVTLRQYAAGGYDNQHVYHYTKGSKMAVAQFNATSSTWQKGGLYILAISDSAILPSPTLTGYSRVTYLDA